MDNRSDPPATGLPGTDSPLVQDLKSDAPPASFGTLITMLASQAMLALGHIPDPVHGRPLARPRMARHFIDLLAILQEKTQGNLTTAEAMSLESLLHELRLIAVSAAER
jgi:hypothetical protein